MTLSLLAAVDYLERELAELRKIAPAALDAQWSPAPVPRPRDDTAERAKGGHSDPVPAIVLDARRLALRAQVLRSEDLLRAALVNVSGVRQGLDRALASWEGDA